MPGIRPAFAGDGEQRAVEFIARRARAGNGGTRFSVFEFQRDRGFVARQDADRIVDRPARRNRMRDRIGLNRGEQKRRVRGKHGMKQRPLPPLAKRGEVGFSGERAESGEVFAGLDRCDQPAQPGRARLERLAFQLGDHRFDPGQIERPALDLARKIKAELEHRVEQRGLRGPRVESLEAGEQIGGCLHRTAPVKWGLSLFIAGIMRCCPLSRNK